MVKQFSPTKHHFSKFNCVSFIIFLVQSHENVCVWYLRLYLPIPISFCKNVTVFRASKNISYHFNKMGSCPFLPLFSCSILLVQQVHFWPSFGTHCTSTYKLDVELLKSNAYYGSFSRSFPTVHAWCKKAI